MVIIYSSWVLFYLLTLTKSCQPEKFSRAWSIWADVKLNQTRDVNWNSTVVSHECPRRVPALNPSLFSHVPPTLNFGLPGEIVEELPSSTKKLLVWKQSRSRSQIIVNIVLLSNFHQMANLGAENWIACWSTPSRYGYNNLLEYQKYDHFPDSKNEAMRKDSSWRMIKDMREKFGPGEFNFSPFTFIVPEDIMALRKFWENNPSKRLWISKPHGGSMGLGIKVISSWDQIGERPATFQRYISKPYLIDGYKFDLRLYVYVSSLEPLRIYLHEDGVVRFATRKYSNLTKDYQNEKIHLTNVDINIHDPKYYDNLNEFGETDYKWTLQTLWRHLGGKGIDTDKLQKRIHDAIIKNFISGESVMYHMTKAHVKSLYSCHELYGIDFIFDENLKPWLLENNAGPFLYNGEISRRMARDTLILAGYRIPKKSVVMASRKRIVEASMESDYYGENITGPILPNSLHDDHLTAYERAKRSYFIEAGVVTEGAQDTKTSILDVLTPSDVRELVEAEDEYQRRGGYQRLFPSPTSHKYLKYFEQHRYGNLLLDAWTRKYFTTPEKGWRFLETLCKENLHIYNPVLVMEHFCLQRNSTACVKI